MILIIIGFILLGITAATYIYTEIREPFDTLPFLIIIVISFISSLVLVGWGTGIETTKYNNLSEKILKTKETININGISRNCYFFDSNTDKKETLINVNYKANGIFTNYFVDTNDNLVYQFIEENLEPVKNTDDTYLYYTKETD